MDKFDATKINAIAQNLRAKGYYVSSRPVTAPVLNPEALFDATYKEMEQYSFIDYHSEVELGYQLRVFDPVKDNKIFFHYPANLPTYHVERTYLNDYLTKRIHPEAVDVIQHASQRLTEIGDAILAELVPLSKYEPWEKGQNILRFLYYPASFDMAKPHTDRDGLTIVTNAQAGLSIKHDGVWSEVPYGSTVYMVGDKLAKEIGVPACEHKVSGEGRDRYSAVFFYDKQAPPNYTIHNGMIAPGGKL